MTEKSLNRSAVRRISVLLDEHDVLSRMITYTGSLRVSLPQHTEQKPVLFEYGSERYIELIAVLRIAQNKIRQQLKEYGVEP